jgi:RHS repeat-associated protein
MAPSTAMTSQLITTLNGSVGVQAVDLNNDGLTDLSIDDRFWIQQGNTSFVPSSEIGSGISNAYVTAELSYMDVNNDGLLDQTYVEFLGDLGAHNYNNALHAHINAGSKFSGTSGLGRVSNYALVAELPGIGSTHAPLSFYYRQNLGFWRTWIDMNGDGNRDVLYPDRHTSSSLQWRIRVATGESPQSSPWPLIDTWTPIVPMNNNDLGQYSFVMDYNKDGLDDFVVFSSGGPSERVMRVFFSSYINGTLSFVNGGVDPFMSKLDYLMYEQVSSPTAVVNPFRGDINNDGIPDLVIGASAYLAKQQQPDLINKITDGFGVITELSYSPLTGDANNDQPLYTPEATAPTFPQIPVNRAMQVVKKVSSSNGQGGYNDTYYHYHGGRQDIHRGFAGFKSITITNATTGVSSISEYRQDWPYNGRISKQTVKDSSGKLISVMNNAYAIHSQNARFPFLSYSLQKSYQLTTTNESSPISVSKTIYAFDTCGNVTDQTTTIGNGFSGTGITGELSSQRTINVYDYDGTTSNCSDDFLTRTTQEFSKAGGNDSKTIITEFTPNPQRDILTRTDFKNDAIQSTTTYAYGTNGVVSSITEVAKDFDGTNEPARVTSFSNFAYGIYPQTIANAKGHQTTLTYDYRFGTIKTESVLGQVTTNTYDALGRQIAVKTPDSAVTLNTSFYCSNASVTCPSDAYYGVATQTTHSSQAGKLGSPLTITFYDALQREVRSVSYSLDGKVVNQATEYMNSGYLKRISEPYSTYGIYADTSSAFAWTVFSNYDSLGRANTVVGADGGSKTTTYATDTDGLVVTDSILVIKPTGGSDTQTSSRTLNALGQVAKVEDALFNTVNYVYDSLGNLESTQVNNNLATQINITHDLAGNKTFISDPDAGNIHFAYNGHGELRKQTWQQGVSGIEKSITWDYDQLGRQISRLDRLPNGSTTAYSWLWDTRQQGQLTSRTGNGFTEEYHYDGFSRLSRQVVTASGLSGGEFIYTYDNFSRPTTTTYPNGFKIQREYHAAGYQTKTTDVTNSASPKVLWTLGNTIDTRGNFNRQLWGNGVVTQTEFDTTSGYLSSIKSGRLSGANQVTNLYGDIQNLSYTFDSLGNLYSRTTARTNNGGAVQETITENFAYDKLNRLTHATTSELFGRTQTYQYDTGGLGNLVNRTDTLTGSSVNNDVGTLAYARVRNAGIHAVTSAGGINYGYDRYGNMTARGSEILTYDVFNKPTRIAGSTTTDFFYGPDHELYKQISGTGTTYKLAGGIYEVTVNGSTTTQKSYVDGVILNTRTFVNGTQTANDTLYLHSDHLGSTESITNALGQFVSRMSFSTWGERQKADWKPGPLTSTELNTYNAITTNGYTGHDQLDNHNLIHMGGRVYDPNLGRFLSADLFIQSPYNSQSFNRYSYTFNNPLSYTDPTGYMSDMMQHFMNVSFHQSTSWQWATTTSYVLATRWTTAATINPDGTLSDTRNGVELSTVNSVSAGSIFQTVSFRISSWPAGAPLGVDGVVAAQYAGCGLNTDCLMQTATKDAEMMSLAVGGELGVIAKVASEVRAAKLAADALKTANARKLGKAGEDAVRAVHNIGDKALIKVNGRDRIPDGINNSTKTLSEIKNVAKQGWTQQLKDYATHAKANGLKFDLYVRPNTQLSGPLVNQINAGTVNLKFIP